MTERGLLDYARYLYASTAKRGLVAVEMKGTRISSFDARDVLDERPECLVGVYDQRASVEWIMEDLRELA